MKLAVATLLALALALLPSAGMARAQPSAMSCHQTADHPMDKAKACAEHCMMLVAVAQPVRSEGPSIDNSVGAARWMAPQLRAAQADVLPDTPPPRR